MNGQQEIIDETRGSHRAAQPGMFSLAMKMSKEDSYILAKVFIGVDVAEVFSPVPVLCSRSFSSLEIVHSAPSSSCKKRRVATKRVRLPEDDRVGASTGSRGKRLKAEYTPGISLGMLSPNLQKRFG